MIETLLYRLDRIERPLSEQAIVSITRLPRRLSYLETERRLRARSRHAPPDHAGRRIKERADG